MKLVFIPAYVANAVLVLLALNSYGSVIKAERSARELDQAEGIWVRDPAQRARNREWWKSINRHAMTEDVRLQSWLVRSLQLVVVGSAINLLGLAYGGPDTASNALMVVGLVVLAAGLILMIAWTRLLGAQLRAQRSLYRGFERFRFE